MRELFPDIHDDRLRLIFTCCHPALALQAQVALTLRLLCGLTTAEVARAFLVSEATMAARITRAKKKIAAARIPYRVPPAAELPPGSSRAGVVHLSSRPGTPRPPAPTWCARPGRPGAATWPGCCSALLPGDADVAGPARPVLLTDARRTTRVTAAARLVLLADQDRSRWDRAAIAEGARWCARRCARGRPAATRCWRRSPPCTPRRRRWEDTDWRESSGCTTLLLHRLAVAGGRAQPGRGDRVRRRGRSRTGRARTLAAEPQLAGYAYLPSARADLLRRLGRLAEARVAYEEALLLTENEVERAFLRDRIAVLTTRRV